MFEGLAAVESVEGLSPDDIPKWVFDHQAPLVLRGLVSRWPSVGNADASFDDLETSLRPYLTDKPVTAYVAPFEVNGRFGYNDAFNGFNFRSGSAPLSDIFERLREQQKPDVAEPLSIYVGSTPVDGWLPGFNEANTLNVPGSPLINFWIGNQTTVSAHYDFPSNIACVVYGRRRFTLFPTDQVDNLYVGPIDRTPSGQAISLVDFDNPDYDRFPRFKKALEYAQTCVLEPGDAIFIPSMWWHHVKAMTPCNMLVNYWWVDKPELLGSPFGALLHAILSIRNLPEPQRRSWQSLMNHYVFDAESNATAHIPEHARGCLGALDQREAQRLKSDLLKRLQ